MIQTIEAEAYVYEDRYIFVKIRHRSYLRAFLMYSLEEETYIGINYLEKRTYKILERGIEKGAVYYHKQNGKYACYIAKKRITQDQFDDKERLKEAILPFIEENKMRIMLGQPVSKTLKLR